jgi:hypothetical protein
MDKKNIGYKLFKVKASQPGKIFPLYVYANEETPMNEWVDAKLGEIASDGKHVKSKLGELALRGGWHLNENVPYVTHIGRKDENGNITYLFEDQVWCEVEYSDNINYQPLVNENGRNKQGKIIPKNACMKEVPVDGFYRYKTNANQSEPWIIAGAIKINRVLSDAEVYDICKAKGYDALPRFGGEFDAAKYGFENLISEYKSKVAI